MTFSSLAAISRNFLCIQNALKFCFYRAVVVSDFGRRAELEEFQNKVRRNFCSARTHKTSYFFLTKRSTLPHHALSAVWTAHWSAEHILRNLVLVWKRWEPICRDDLIFYSRNIKRNQLTCFSYHFFCQSAKNLCRDPPMKKMIKTANTRRAVIHMKGFVRNYCFF